MRLRCVSYVRRGNNCSIICCRFELSPASWKDPNGDVIKKRSKEEAIKILTGFHAQIVAGASFAELVRASDSLCMFPVALVWCVCLGRVFLLRLCTDSPTRAPIWHTSPGRQGERLRQRAKRRRPRLFRSRRNAKAFRGCHVCARRWPNERRRRHGLGSAHYSAHGVS